MRGTCGEALVQHGQLDVLGAEIVAPLRDAVRLVDGEQRDAGACAQHALEQAEKALGQQAFGRDVEQIQLARQQAPLHRRAPRPQSERGVEEGGAHAELQQRIDLVLHQRDQRRDDDADAAAQQGGNLVAQRLAAAGGHQHQRIAAADDVVDDLGLGAAEGGVTEDGAQQLQGGGFVPSLRYP